MDRHQGGMPRERTHSFRLDQAEPTRRPAVIRYAALQRARARARASRAMGVGESMYSDSAVPAAPADGVTSQHALRLRRALAKLRHLVACPVMQLRGAEELVEALSQSASLAEAATEELARQGATSGRRLKALVSSVERRAAELDDHIHAAEAMRRAAFEYQLTLDWFVRVGGIAWNKFTNVCMLIHESAQRWPDPVVIRSDVPRATWHIAASAVSVARVALEMCQRCPSLNELGEWAVHAALLSDVGCLCLCDSDYCVPLDADARLETHPLRSADIAAALRSVAAPVVRAIREHHEAPDGTGYPDGKRGSELSVLGQLIAVCTAYVNRLFAAVAEPGSVPAVRHAAVLTELQQLATQGKLNQQLTNLLPDTPPLVLSVAPGPHQPDGCSRLSAAA